MPQIRSSLFKVLTNMLLYCYFINYKVRPLSICTVAERFWTMVHPDRSTQEDSRRSFVQARPSWIWSRVTQWSQGMRTLASNDRSNSSDENNGTTDIPSILDRGKPPIRYRVTEDDRGQGSQDLQTFLWREVKKKNGVLAIKKVSCTQAW
jgi:hypothetical protein